MTPKSGEPGDLYAEVSIVLPKQLDETARQLAQQLASKYTQDPRRLAVVVDMVDQRFLAKYHVRRGVDFQRAYRRRLVASNPTLVVYGCDNELPYPRLGLSVSRKVGNAVVRIAGSG